PADRVVRPHRSPRIGRLVERGEDVHPRAGIGGKVVPLVGAGPPFRQVASRRVHAIGPGHESTLYRRMAAEIGPDQAPVPAPSVLRAARRMDPDESASAADVALEGGSL